jgi:outer membrane lipopolysaccharide assembly protein LptE/RlpB
MRMVASIFYDAEIINNQDKKPSGMKRKTLMFICIALCLCLVGCGYTLVGRGSLPKHIETIAIPVFENDTMKSGVEDIVTQAFIEEFVKGGKLRLVSENNADALLIGAINSYQSDEVADFDEGVVTSYYLTIAIDIELRDLKNDVTLWEKKDMTEKETFSGGPDVNPTDEQENEDEALEKLAEELATQVFTLSTEEF